MMRLFTLGFFATIICTFFFLNCKQNTRFRLRKSADTGIDFVNTITERDTLNILDMEFVYNGGGVGVGDLNGDGLDDLYFTGNQVDNRLYLNRGQLRFEDITQAAGVGKTMPYQWSSGINMVDINCDGKLDIYVCNTINPDPEQRRNLLFINQGNDQHAIPKFKEMAREYGLDDPHHDSNAQFFDYDLDGDLDVFIGVNFIDHQYPNQYFNRSTDGSSPTRDLLLRNDYNTALGHAVFTDVSLAAGIVYAGYSHSTLINDFNLDGWPDIFVANDYLSNDLVYINNHDGTFTNRAAEVLKHQAMSSMGSDLADVNNDGRLDFFATEMQPWYNKRKKLFQGGSSYQTYIFNEQYKYEYQYTRNMLQLNAGIHPETGLPLFSEIGLYAGVQETDWSWTPLLADLDNDGVRDLYVTNGFPRDVTDHDFAEFRKGIVSTLTSKGDLYNMIPQIRQPNFMFQGGRTASPQNQGKPQEGGWKGADVTKNWGLFYPSFSNGAAYADLDHDGDLDLVVNNIDEPAFLFENTSAQQGSDHNFFRIETKGTAENPGAIGAVVRTWWAGQCQAATILTGRGYISCSEHTVHIGLGAATQVDSVEVIWPATKDSAGVAVQRHSVFRDFSENQTITINTAQSQVFKPRLQTPGWFTDLATKMQIDWKNEENDHIDFNFQRTLPHKVSQYGPPISVGDANGDGLEDFFMGGSSRYMANWWWQQPDGSFRHDSIAYKTDSNLKEEDSATLLFDADGDNDLDLYLGRGSGQHPEGDTLYQDFLCINDGAGHFKYQKNALPVMLNNTSCVKAADIDGDGDLDLFVGSRMRPKAYPMADKCYLLRNNKGVFEDITEQYAPQLARIGMISDALWTDFNSDGQPDLLLAGEFMPLTFFKNQQGHFAPLSNPFVCGHAVAELPDLNGWWNSLAAADLDNDGDMDYIAGNFGENLYFKSTPTEPLRVYAKDFDNNGTVDPFISLYWRDSLYQKHEYFYHPREDAVKQLVLIRKKFKTYGEYGLATVQQFFSSKELQGATILSATNLKSSIIENLGNGRFRLIALPDMAQLAPIYGILAYDADSDGLLDLLLTGNDFGIELQQGRADALQGLLLHNRGQLRFEPVGLEESHFVVPGDARGLATILLGNNDPAILAAQNRGKLKVFHSNTAQIKQVLPLQHRESKAIITLVGGGKRIQEFAWGTGFAAQSGRHLIVDKSVKNVVLFDQKGAETRRFDY